MSLTIYRVAQPITLRGRGGAPAGRFVAVITTGLPPYGYMVINLLPSATETGRNHCRHHGGGDPVRFAEEERLVLRGALVRATPDELHRLTPHLPKWYKQ